MQKIDTSPENNLDGASTRAYISGVDGAGPRQNKVNDMNKHFSIGIDAINGTRTERGVTYYAHEINAYVTVSEADVARLGAMLEAGEPHAYSVWCSETAHEVAS